MISNTVSEQYTPGDRKAARARFNLSETDLVLLSVGRLDKRERYKGHNRVLAELTRLPARPGQTIRYLVAGDGDDLTNIEAEARRLGVLGRVQFLGHVETSLLPDLYRAADLFALPSLGEGFGIVFLEAMACGTPAIGLASGGAPDALGDGELGICIAAQTFAPELARAVYMPRPDPEILSARVQERFGKDTFRTLAATVFERLLTQGIVDER
ncbi:MAG: glycosyltransferase [Hyphomonadaceae bacterium]